MSGRLPPGQFETKAFPVLQSGRVIDSLNESNYSLEIYGEVSSPQKVSFSQLKGWPHADVSVDIHCVTTWSKFDTKWSGVLFTDLCKIVKPTSKAKFVIMECEEGHTTSLPLRELLQPNVMVADSYDGKPIEAKHGGPVRMVVPHKYFYKSAKWLRKLKFVEKDEPGYWEVRGYSNTADPFKEERYSF
jgi:DMSO/TMAO reductase YedYZ molybdopterin-dependent catalytic subunit